MFKRLHSGLFFWLAALVVVVAVVIVLMDVSQHSSSAASTPTSLPISAQEVDYVTSNSCRACHPGNYASWHASFHRTMTQVATPATLIPDTSNVELSFAGRQYKLERRGENIFVSDRSLGETDYGPPRQVVLLTGSHN